MSYYEQQSHQDLIDRRGFLRSLVGATVAAGLGLTVVPAIANGAGEIVSEVTGRPTGNAGLAEELTTECEGSADPGQCAKDHEVSDDSKRRSVFEAPIWEEAVFRGVPSVLLDKLSGDPRDGHPTEVLKRGTRSLTFTKREVITGVASSILFGASHNITKDGFDTRTIPIEATTFGMVAWGLSRKFGLSSAIAAHSAFNYSIIRSLK